MNQSDPPAEVGSNAGLGVTNEGAHPAVFTLHTPTGFTHCCVRHARMGQRIYQAMGYYTNATKAPDGAQCENCVNEAKRDA